MTKRLGLFLGLGVLGVVLLLAGLVWDALLHGADPTLAGREGVFAWSNPGHVLLGLGLGTVVVGLIGAVDATLTMSGSRRWANPAVRNGCLVASTALVVAAAGITSWSAGSGQHQADESAHLAAVGGGHSSSATETAELAAAPGHDHGDAPAAEAAATPNGEGHTHSDVASTPATVAAHDHSDRATAAASAVAQPVHSHSTTEPTGGGSTAAGPTHEAVPGGAAGPPTPAPPPPPGPVTVTRYGPFVLPPAGVGGDADHANVVIPDAPRVCSDCFLLGIEPDLVYADGSPANLDTGVMVHHAVFLESGKEDVTCSGSQAFPGHLGRRFFASGNERTRGQLPDGFGYSVGHTPWNAVFHIMNHSAVPKTVFFTLKARWVPASSGGILPVTPVWLDMGNCNTSEYDVPAGPSSRHWQWTSTITGRIVSTGGHVHAGGIRTTLSNATTGQRLCTSWAGYGTKPAFMGSVESMSVCSWDTLGPVKSGEVLDLEAFYNSAEPVPGAMGIMLAYVYETPNLGGGTPPPPEVTGDTPAPPASTPPPSSHEGHPH
jgi:hypothetical protein